MKTQIMNLFRTIGKSGEMGKSLKSLKSLMQIFATYATFTSTIFVGKESCKSTVRYALWSRISLIKPLLNPYLTLTRFRLSLGSNLSRFSLASLICVCMLTIGVGNAWGAVTLDFTAQGYANSKNMNNVSLTVSGVTATFAKGSSGTNPTYYTSGTHVRCYYKNTITVSSSSTMTSIVFTFASGEGSNAISANSGTYNSSTKTWTGSATSVTFTIGGTSGHRRIQKLAVTTGSSYTVVWTINPAAGGTLSTTSGTSTTVTPNSAYTYGSPAYTVTTGSATVSQSTNTFTATPSANCTIRINMVEKPKYTVTLMDDGDTRTQASYGASVTLPSRDGCTGYEFAGWTKTWVAPQSSWTTTAPTIIPAGSYTPSADENLYPVYTKTESGGGAITLFSEDFAALTTGNDASTSGPSSTATSTSTLKKFSSMSNAYPAGGTVKLGGGSSIGYLTTNTITAALGDVITISFKVKGWTTVEGNIQVESGNSSFTKPSATTYTSTISDSYQTKSVTVTLTKANPTIKIGTTAKRAFLDDLVVTKAGSTTYYISVPSCCTPLGTINGSVSLTQAGNSVTVKNWTYTKGGGAEESNIATYDVYLYSNADSYAAPIQTQTCAYSAKGTGVTFTGLSYSATYKIKIGATGNSGYCGITPVQVTNINSTSTETFQLECEAAGLAFGTGSVSKTFGDAAFTNPLTNSHSVAVTYSSTDETVATVNSYGQVTIKKAGSATITASSLEQTVASVKYCAGNASYTLTVNKANISPTLSYTSTNLSEGSTSSDPTITGNTGEGTVSYSSSNNDVATVDAGTGVVTAVAAGSATITATIGATTNYNGNTATATFTITEASQCVAPTFSVAAGTYNSAQTVTISSTTPGSTIYYTTNGDEPTTSSSHGTEGEASASVTVSSSLTLKAIAYKGGMTTSDVSDAAYVICSTDPSFSTTSSSNITITGARVTCAGITKGTCDIDAYGIVYGTSEHPTGNAQEKGTDASTNVSSYYVDLTGLTDATTYYARPYATVNGKTVYGTEISLTTLHIPEIEVNETSRAFGTKKVDGSYEMSFIVSGEYLQGNIGLAISGTNEAMFSVDKTSLTPSTGTVGNTTVTVTYTPSAAGLHSATVSITSTNATTKTVTLSGTGQYEDTYMTAMHEGVTAWTSYAAGVTKAGTGYDVPNPGDIAAGDREGTGCEGIHYHFAGWVEESYKASPSGHIVAASGTKDASNKTFWAVWEKEAAGSIPPAEVFSEDFSDCSGTGGNDGSWSGSIAGDDLPSSITSTWSITAGRAAKGCAKFGTTNKGGGSAGTPDIVCGSATAATLTFRAGAWNGSSEGTTLYLEGTNCDLSESSVTTVKGSFSSYEIDITNITDDISILFYTSASNNRFFLDDIVVTTAAVISYEDPKVECICSADPEAGTAAVDAEGTFSASSIAVKATGASTGHADCSYTDYGFVWSSSVTTPTLVEGTGAAADNCTKAQVGTDGQVTTFAGSISGSFTANNPIYVRSYVKNGKAAGTYQYSSVVTITPRSVTFNLNGHGSSTPAAQFVNNGSNATDPSYAESVTGYIFGGWYKEVGCTNQWNFASDVVSGESKTLYAKWTPISYSVRFNNNDENYLGTATGSMDNESFTYDQSKALTTNAFSLAGYDFAGWALTADGSVAHSDEAVVGNLSSTNATVDLYAIWTPKNYDVTLAATGETSSVGEQVVTATYNAAMPTTKKGSGYVVAPSRTGYTFTGWEYSSTTYYDYNAGTSTLSSAHVWDQPNSTTTLTPKWSINSYTLTWDLAGGTVSVAGTGAEAGATGTPSSSVVYNSAITRPTVTRAGYNFAGWDVDVAATMPAEATTYTATWTAKTLTSISLAEASISVYVGEIKYVNVIFDPTDILSKAFTHSVTPNYCLLTSYDSYNKIKITGGKAGADISVNRTETVGIKYTADETKTASISVTVKPLPTVTFVDLIHNKSDFANSGDGWTAGTGVLSSTVTTGVVSHAKKTPAHTDVSAPVGGNACETGHLHLMGWIRSDYSKVADYMNGTGAAPTVSELTSAGTEYWFLPDADINTETYNGKTFYAVWAVEE